MAERVSAVPQFRHVLRSHTLDLVPPDWVSDPNFDIARHIPRAALPRPGGEAELFEFVANVMAQRLDRDHPLWQCWIIDGLDQGRWALLMKLHHCIADGIAAMHLFSRLSDDGEGETFATTIRAATQPSSDRIGVPALGRNPLRWPSDMWRLATRATGTAARVVEGAIGIAAGLAQPAARSSLTGSVTSNRRYSTIKDVALAAVTASLRSALAHVTAAVNAIPYPLGAWALRGLYQIAAARRGDVGNQRTGSAPASSAHGPGSCTSCPYHPSRSDCA